MLAVTELIGFGCNSGDCSCAPAYVTGDRTASITVTAAASTIDVGTPLTNFVDGAFGNNATDSCAFASAFSVDATKWIKFQFAALTKITEAKWYQRDAVGVGTWKWQGSLDDSAYIDIGSSFTVGGSTTQTQTQLNGNLVGYLFYRLLGVSGTATDATYLQEVEFQQCVC